MTDREVQLLLERYRNGTCTPEERVMVGRWYQSESTKRAMPLDPEQPTLHKEQMWNQIQDTIERIPSSEVRVRKVRKLSRRTRLIGGIAASLLLMLSFMTYWYWLPNYQYRQEFAKIKQHDVAPGGDRAILTLADGTAIVLDSLPDGEVARQQGSQIIQTAVGMLAYSAEGIASMDDETPLYNTLRTPVGGQYQLTLPDGTRVWLNASSSLTFPTSFKGAVRRVELKGEGYFEVAKNKEKPFKVIAGGQEVRVLGTHFNISSYEDDPAVTTTVLEGSVQVTDHKSTNKPDSLILKPGESAILRAHTLRKAPAKTEEVVDWTQGKFQFTNASLAYLMPKIARWYNIEIAYEGKVPSGRFSGQVSRSHNLSQILEILQATDLVHFKMEEPTQAGKERRIVVLP